MSKVRLYGDTSGFVDLKAPDVASNVTITLPNTTGPFATEAYADAAVAAIPEIAGIGSNVVTAFGNVSFSTSSATFVDVTGVSVTITPTLATSKVLIICTMYHKQTARGFGEYEFQLLGGASVLHLTGGSSGNDSSNGPRGIFTVGMSVVDSPATTSPITYKAQARNISRGVVILDRSITAIEVAA